MYCHCMSSKIIVLSFNVNVHVIEHVIRLDNVHIIGHFDVHVPPCTVLKGVSLC